MIRKPAVAGYFYPGSSEGIETQIRAFNLPSAAPVEVFGVIAPHAGYRYSGKVAAMVYSGSKPRGPVILIGPNHGSGKGLAAPAISMMTRGAWEFPNGEMEINAALAGEILKSSCEIHDAGWAHEEEHSLEVHLPFMGKYWDSPEFVPIIISRLDDDQVLQLGECLYKSVVNYGKPVTLAASTDMSHYVPQDVAARLDKIAMERIEAMDAEGLLKVVHDRRISMCGVQPVAVALEVCKRMGAREARLVRYTTSGEASGDYSSVVGYCGYVIV